MTREQLSSRILQMGFSLVESSVNKDIYQHEDLVVNVHEQELTTKWYVGEKQYSRTSQRRTWNWKNKRYTSRSYEWDEIEQLIKIKENEKAEYKPINDQSFQGKRILPDEVEKIID